METNKSRVFITQRPKPKANGFMPDLTPATEFGEIVYVFDSNDYVFASPEISMERAKQVLDDFDPDNDHLLYPMTGDPAAVYIIAMIMGYWFSDKNISWLRWDRNVDSNGKRVKSGAYVPINIPLFNE